MFKKIAVGLIIVLATYSTIVTVLYIRAKDNSINIKPRIINDPEIKRVVVILYNTAFNEPPVLFELPKEKYNQIFNEFSTAKPLDGTGIFRLGEIIGQLNVEYKDGDKDIIVWYLWSYSKLQFSVNEKFYITDGDPEDFRCMRLQRVLYQINLELNRAKLKQQKE